MWRRSLRIVLALFVAGLGAAVLLGLRERAVPAGAIVVERTDPDAVIQSRKSRIVQADSSGDNFIVSANHQLTYSDGRVRMLDGVEVTVDAQDDLEGFVLQGAEASVTGDKQEVLLAGDVTFVSGDGLEARSESATYTRGDQIVRMPSAASFVRAGMRAAAQQAVYDRTGDLLRLWGDAEILLTEGESTTGISSASAEIAQTDGRMTFDGGVDIDTGRLRMAAVRAEADVTGEASALDALRIEGGAQVRGLDRGPGRLRSMTASEIRVDYVDSGQRMDQAALAGDARLVLFGAGGARGTEISARSMDVGFTAAGDGVSALTGREDVVLEAPAEGSRPGQRISADALRASGRPGGGLEQARFDGSVEYRENGGDVRADASARIGRAARLDATFGDDLSALEGATFRGGVTFEGGEAQGFGDEAHYAVADDAVDLASAEPDGPAPRVVDRRGAVQARTIRLVFDGPRIEARGSVESVLNRTAAAAGSGEVRHPGLLDGDQPVLVIAEELAYDGRTQTATYGGGVRLWQGETEFRGDTLVLEESVGNLRIDGAVRTRFPITQLDDDTGLPKTSVSGGRGRSMRYENDAHRVIYTADAGFDGPRGDLTADEIQLHLHADDSTLDRVTAAGGVVLVTPGRRVSGDALVYVDSDGRYEMTGRPVRMIEEVDGECRETTGRTLTFFLSAEDASVDGRAEARTETTSGKCPELMRR